MFIFSHATENGEGWVCCGENVTDNEHVHDIRAYTGNGYVQKMNITCISQGILVKFHVGPILLLMRIY